VAAIDPDRRLPRRAPEEMAGDAVAARRDRSARPRSRSPVVVDRGCGPCLAA